MMRRRMVGVEIAGPLCLSELECRRCGGQPIVWHLVGVPRGERPRYFECQECGLGEVVWNTPMQFIEPSLTDTRLRSRYEEYRRGNGLVPLGTFSERKLTTDKYEEKV